MATTPNDTITLDGSGETTDTRIDPSIDGLVMCLIVNKDGQTNNPVITIKDSSSGRPLLSGVTHSATGDKVYPVREAVVNNSNTSTGSYNPYYVDSPLTLTVTGGDAAGTVTIRVQYIPTQG